MEANICDFTAFWIVPKNVLICRELIELCRKYELTLRHYHSKVFKKNNL